LVFGGRGGRVRFGLTSVASRGYRIPCGSSLEEEVSVVNHHTGRGRRRRREGKKRGR
jgi:hypothetical protein